MVLSWIPLLSSAVLVLQTAGSATGAPATSSQVLGVFVETCSAPDSQGWTWDGVGAPKGGGVVRRGPQGTGGCLVAPTPFSSHQQLTFVTPCPVDAVGETPSCSSPRRARRNGSTTFANDATSPWCWKALSAPFGDTLVVADEDASAEWGPAALLGQAVVGHAVMLYSLSSVGGYCAQHHSCDWTFNGSSFINKESGNCLGLAALPPPPPPPPPPSPPKPRPPPPPPPNLAYTCERGQPLSGTPVCNSTLSFADRAAALAAMLTNEQHADLFFSYPATPYLPELNVKSWSLDHTCIHGVNKQRNVSLFPHEIAQGASWDVDLVRRIMQATNAEARILSSKAYVATCGHSAGSVLSCDGGPSAAQAHDPRWGRTSWTWGEDPFHIAVMGRAAYSGLQDPRPNPGGHPDDVFLAVRATVPYYLGYHGGTGDPPGFKSAFNATNRSLADSYWPAYGALLSSNAPSPADGVMCAMSEINGVPACVDPLLLTVMLREQWKSDAIVQTDCCDSVGSVATFLGIKPAEALARYVDAGGGAYFGFDVTMYRQAMQAGMASGAIDNATVRARGTRVLETEMRLGMFDMHRPEYPFGNASYPWDALDGPAHRKLASDAAANVTVLLKNREGLLPLRSRRLGDVNQIKDAQPTIAVIGPFARCAGGLCYAHDYAGSPSFTIDFVDGVTAVASMFGFGTVSYAAGSNATCSNSGCSSRGRGFNSSVWEQCPPTPEADAAIADAVRLASTSSVTVLGLGLGESVEGEGCDRPNMTLPLVQQRLYKAVAAAVATAGHKLVLVLVSAAGIDVDESLADAVLWQPYAGQAAGEGLAAVLFGTTNPSARLPATWYTQEWADGMANDPSLSILSFDLEVGLGRTHRYLRDSSRYAVHGFGYGLSYTNFSYESVSVSHSQGAPTACALAGGGLCGSPSNLSVTVALRNTGVVGGAEVVQLYASTVAVPGLVVPRQNLVGFAKVYLEAGASATVALDVKLDSLATASDNGIREVTAGNYTMSACGHQPGDPEGDSGSSGPCVTAHITLP